MAVSLLEIDPARYVSHAVHRGERVWPETNCFVDLWIELLHGLGHEPIACLPFTVGLDLEGDQWTFFKFPFADLAALYGIEIFELNVWWSLLQHVEAEVRRGRPVIVEMDAWFLPDTAGTSYRAQHVKTSIAVERIDVAARRMGYFHNAGYYTLEGDDFAGVFRLDRQAFGPEHLPPYVEVAKLDWQKRLDEPELVEASLALLRSHLGRLPKSNPFTRYKARFGDDLGWMSAEGMTAFHAYAFSTLRQLGANFELLATYLRWLEERGHAAEGAAEDFQSIAEGAKAMQFKLARAVGGKRAMDHAAMIGAMEASWASGIERLLARFG